MNPLLSEVNYDDDEEEMIGLIDGHFPTRVRIFINARLRFKGSGIILAECTFYLRKMVHEMMIVVYGSVNYL